MTWQLAAVAVLVLWIPACLVTGIVIARRHKWKDATTSRATSVTTAAFGQSSSVRVHEWNDRQIARATIWIPDNTDIDHAAPKVEAMWRQAMTPTDEHGNGTVEWGFTRYPDRQFIIARALDPLPDVARLDNLEPHPDRVEIGTGRGGRIVAWFWLLYPHLLIVGKTRKGKSRALIWIARRVLALGGQLVIIDPKDEDLSGYEGHAGVLAVANTIDEARSAIRLVLAELGRRRDANGAARRAGQPPPSFTPLVLEVDEVQLLVQMDGGRPDKSECVAGMATVARIGARYHVHLVPATQRPDVKDSIPGAVRDLCDAVLAVGRLGSIQASTMAFGDAKFDPVPGDAPKGRSVLAQGGDPEDVQVCNVTPPVPAVRPPGSLSHPPGKVAKTAPPSRAKRGEDVRPSRPAPRPRTPGLVDGGPSGTTAVPLSQGRPSAPAPRPSTGLFRSGRLPAPADQEVVP